MPAETTIRFENIFEADLAPGDMEFLGEFQEQTHNINNVRSVAFALVLAAAALISSWNALTPAIVALYVLLCSVMIALRPTAIYQRLGFPTAAERIRAQAIVAAFSCGVANALPIAFGWSNQLGELAILAVGIVVFGPIAYAHTPSAAKAFQLVSAPLFAGSLIIDGSTEALIYLGLLGLFAATSLTVCRFIFSNFATRYVRDRDLSDTADTVRLLLHDYQTEMADWLWEVDSKGQFTNYNRRGLEATGKTIDELSAMRPLDLLHRPSDRERMIEIVQARQPFRDVEFAIMVKGEERWWRMSGTPHFADDGSFVRTRGVCSDITEAKRADAKIAYMARYDALTDLPNRTMFAETLGRALHRRKDDGLIAVLYVDLDHFKAINDTLGHAIGDAVLKEAATRIGSCLGLNDIVSRQGGDEFAVLLPDICDREAADAIGQAIIDSMAQELLIDEQAVNIGASIGIAFAPHHASHSEDLLKCADLALYNAKQQGRGQFAHFAPHMQQEMQLRRQTEIDLRTAVQNGDQLELYYQPLINLSTSKAVGYEALLRWHHPKLGMVNPDDFIPVAEENGLIVPIGEWVIRNAVAEVRRWPKHLSVSINLSPVQLASPGLVSTIVNALATHGVEPHRLEVEITESVLMNDSEANLRVLHQLRSLGIQIALDDFGTGYSSLNYLRGFPFDKIKIDRCFVSDIDSREDNKAIIRAVTGLAASLGMVTTAEGVERAEELELLRAEGCTEVQGFYFSRPMPADQIGERQEAVQPEVDADSIFAGHRAKPRAA